MIPTKTLMAVAVLVSTTVTMPSAQGRSSNPMKPSAAEVAEFRALEVKLWEAWNARLVPADARPFYSQDPKAIHFDFSPMKFTGWAEYERVATQAIGGSGRAETTINDDFTLIKQGDLAVTAFTFHVDFYGKDGAKRGGGNARETDVWVKENGHWVVAHQHMSFPSAPGPAAGVAPGAVEPRP